MWINHDNFWNAQSILGHPMVVLMQKLKLLRGFLRAWNKDTFGHLDSSIAVAK